MSAWETGWGLATVVGATAAWWRVRAIGLTRGRAALVIGIFGVAAFAGARAEFIVENGVPLAAWFDHRGLRAAGAMVALAVVGPTALWLFRIPILTFLDALAPVIALAIFVGRFGCLVQGCCYGVSSDLWWSVTYPFGSAAFANHLRRGLIPSDAAASLPVHPLALYFGLDALAIAAFLLWMTRRARYPGQILLWFLVLRGWSKVLIERLRERTDTYTLNRSGDVEFWLALAASLVLLAVTIYRGASVATSNTRNARK